MAKIYEFPQGAERSKLKKEIIRERKKRLRETNGNPVIRHAKWFWFYLRLATAGALHLVSVISLAVWGLSVKLFSGLVECSVLLHGSTLSASSGRRKISRFQ